MMTWTMAGVMAVLLITGAWVVGFLMVVVAAHSHGKEWAE